MIDLQETHKIHRILFQKNMLSNCVRNHDIHIFVTNAKNEDKNTFLI